MPIEYEYQFRNYDKTKLIKEMKQMGAKKKGDYLFRVNVFEHPNKIPDTYIRVRDEGFRITMTYKYQPLNKFADENEIIIDDFDEAITILNNLGCKTKYYYEKIREIWNLDNCEIVFDTIPCNPEIMEIEAVKKRDLTRLIKILELEQYRSQSYNNDVLNELFGFTIPKSDKEVTFINSKKLFGKLVTKNKPLFNKIVDEQKEKYKELKLKLKLSKK
jgi:predicted adenylyl cyclase CyaB